MHKSNTYFILSEHTNWIHPRFFIRSCWILFWSTSIRLRESGQDLLMKRAVFVHLAGTVILRLVVGWLIAFFWGVGSDGVYPYEAPTFWLHCGICSELLLTGISFNSFNREQNCLSIIYTFWWRYNIISIWLHYLYYPSDMNLHSPVIIALSIVQFHVKF